jgi:hypothetical protein
MTLPTSVQLERTLLRRGAPGSLTTSCFSGEIDTASSTTSFMRKGMLPVIVGNPRGGSGPPVRHEGDERHGHHERDDRAEGAANAKLLAPKPEEEERAEQPFRKAENQLAPRSPNPGYNHDISGASLT